MPTLVSPVVSTERWRKNPGTGGASAAPDELGVGDDGGSIMPGRRMASTGAVPAAAAASSKRISRRRPRHDAQQPRRNRRGTRMEAAQRKTARQNPPARCRRYGRQRGEGPATGIGATPR